MTIDVQTPCPHQHRSTTFNLVAGDRVNYKTIEEAKEVIIPNLNDELIEKYKLLAKSVQFGNEGRTIKLQKIYCQVDSVAEVISPLMVCQKGCSHCCKIDVLITSVEAEYIQRNTSANMNSGHSLTRGFSSKRTPCTWP